MATEITTLKTVEKIEMHNSANTPSDTIHVYGPEDRVFSVVETFFDYILGACVGVALGYLIGKWAGAEYTTYFRPAYMSDLNEVKRWWLMPYEFASTGIHLGALVGTVVITGLATIKQLRNRKIKEEEGGDKMK